MGKDEADLELSRERPVPTQPRSTDLGALLVSLLLFGSSFGLAAIEDEPRDTPTATDATETETPGLEDDLAGQLTVAPEAEGGYDRKLFKHWVDSDRDGCDTRQEVLIVEAQGQTESASERGCPVTAGEWISVYDGVVVTNPRQLDIDHMVPLKEAWESTAATWSPEDRESYANDLDEPDALLAVTASTNRSKSDRDPAEWKPPDESTWCTYAMSWIKVKVKWSLNADEPEIAALREMLATC